MPEITVLSSADRTSWASLTDPPGTCLRRVARSTRSRPATRRSRAACGSGSPTRGRSSGPTTRSPTSWRARRTSRPTTAVCCAWAPATSSSRRRGRRDVACPRDPREVLRDLHGWCDRRHVDARDRRDRARRVDHARERRRATRTRPDRSGMRGGTPDTRFSTGVWRREPETGTFDREYHEVACMIEGDVEIETEDGRVLRAGAGDVLVTPEGSSGLWRARRRSGSSGRSITSSPYGSLDPEQRPRAEPLLVEAGAADRPAPWVAQTLSPLRPASHLQIVVPPDRAVSELRPAVRARAGWVPRRDDDQLPGRDRGVGGDARRRAVLHRSRRTRGTADDRERRVLVVMPLWFYPRSKTIWAAIEFLVARSDPEYRTPVATRPSSEGPGVADGSGDRPGPPADDRLVAGRVGRVDLERVRTARQIREVDAARSRS